MPDETTEGTAARPVLRTLADKVNWLIDPDASCWPRTLHQCRGGRPDRADHGRAGVAYHCLEAAERAGG